MNKIILIFTLLVGVLSTNAQTYAIGEIDDNGGIVDPARSNRVIWTHYYYPATSAGTNTPVASGTFPLVVFGHGFVMAYSEYKSIADSLVSRGYVVVFPRTEGNLLSTNHENFAKDMQFLTDYFQTQSQTNSSFKLYGKLMDKTAIMGHSMGGGAAVWTVANTSRVTTMLTLAPVNTNDPVQSKVWAPNITKPSLIITGSQDCVADGSMSTGNGDSIYNKMTNTSLPYKYTVKLTGANHCNFASAPGFNCTFGETSSGCRNTSMSASNVQINMFKMIRPWLDYHLKGICSSWTLFSNYVTTSPATTLTYRNQGNPVFPTANAGADQTLTCTITSATIGTSAQAGMTYVWGNGATTALISVSNPATYTVTVTSAQNGCTATDAVVVSQNITPPTANAGTDQLLTCTTTSVTLGTPAQAGFTYVWSNALTTATFPVSSAGSFTLTVTNTQNGCSAFDMVNVTQNIAPPTVPTITANGSSLTTSSTGVGYQWYLNGVVVVGATNQSYTPTQDGAYTLTVTNPANGCTASSSAFNYNITGIQDEVFHNFVIQNPVANEIRLNGIKEIISYSIYNLEGKRVKEGKAQSRIDVSELHKGIYIIEFNQKNTFKFVKE